MTTFSTLKQADNDIKQTVFGFVREFQDGNKDMIVPMAINYLCLQYYYIAEYFAYANHKFIEMSENKLTIKNIDGYNGYSIYCHQWINSMSSMICKWIFKINHKQNNWSYIMQFGLTSKQLENGEFCSNITVPNYGFRSDYFRIKNGTFYGDTKEQRKPENLKMFTSGDIITLILDLNRNAFICLINDKEELRFDDIQKSKDIKYKMAWSLLNREDSITLLKYYEIYK